MRKNHSRYFPVGPGGGGRGWVEKTWPGGHTRSLGRVQTSLSGSLEGSKFRWRRKRRTEITADIYYSFWEISLHNRPDSLFHLRECRRLEVVSFRRQAYSPRSVRRGGPRSSNTRYRTWQPDTAHSNRVTSLGIPVVSFCLEREILSR